MDSINFGYYYFIITLIATLGIFAKYGFDLLLIRFIPKYLANSNLNELKGILIYTNVKSIKNAIFIMVIFVLFVFLLDQMNPIENISFYFIGILLLPFLIFLQINQAKLNGFGKITHSQLPERIILPVSIIVFVFCFTEVFGYELMTKNILYIHLLALTITFLVSRLFLNSTLRKFKKISALSLQINDWKSISLQLIIITTGTMILTNIDVLMIGFILDKELSGIYGIATRISVIIAFGLFAINTVIAPKISRLFAENKIKDLKLLLFRTSRFNLFISSLFLLIIILFHNELLNIFGIEYARGGVALTILCIGQFINVATGSVGVLMIMTGLEAIVTKIILFSILLNIILNLILILYLGINGAAIATAITIVFSNIMMLYFAYKATGINPSPIRLVKWKI
jgi:O-antigen/teichoic acid export membrane protein